MVADEDEARLADEVQPADGAGVVGEALPVGEAGLVGVVLPADEVLPAGREVLPPGGGLLPVGGGLLPAGGGLLPAGELLGAAETAPADVVPGVAQLPARERLPETVAASSAEDALAASQLEPVKPAGRVSQPAR